MWYFFGDHPELSGARRTDIYVRWYHKFEEGFEGHPPKMARLGGFAASDWTLSFMNHFWISPSTEIVIGVPASNIASGGTVPVEPGYNAFTRWLPTAWSDFDYSDSLHDGRWVCLEMRVKLNSPFAPDGILRYWADGILITDTTGVDLVAGYTERGINGVRWDCYWNAGERTTSPYLPTKARG